MRDPSIVPNYRLFAPADHVEHALREHPAFSMTAHALAESAGHPTRAVVQTLNYLTDNGRVHRRVRGTDPGPDGGWASLPATWGLTG